MSAAFGGAAPVLSIKDPADVLRYLQDFAPDIAAMCPGDTIKTIVGIVPAPPDRSIMVNAQAIVSSPTGQPSAAVAIMLGGGNSGTIYNVAVSVQTLRGSVLRRSFVVPVHNR